MGSEQDDFDYISSDDNSVADSDQKSYLFAEDEVPDTAVVDTISGRLRRNGTILNDDELKKRQETDISTVENVLSVSKGAAIALLRQFAWNVTTVNEQWFADEDKVRGIVNLPVKSKPFTLVDKMICNICFDEVDSSKLLYAACGVHPFCAVCWKTYLITSIKDDGPGCLMLRCPEPSCKAVVEIELVDRLVSGKYKVKYYKFLRRSYVEDSRNRKWCPAPGCEFAVQYDGGSSENYDVVCKCLFKFCWNCLEDNHRPVDCETVRRWLEKNNSDSENAKWILAYTKPCPKCKRPIEKNQGCNHMTCRTPCGYRFCWLCLKPLKDHVNCNKFRSKDEDSRKLARMHSERYTHYYERWASNGKSRELAAADLIRAKEEHIVKLYKVQAESLSQLQIVKDVWEQIAECRRVLQWTYAYGFYLPEKDQSKVSLFEYLQGEAESALERLHHCAEKEIEKYLYADVALEDFKDFRSKLACLNDVTRTFFENLVTGLENGLSEVQNFSDGIGGTAVSKKQRTKL